ncbi:major facilitator superfamily transporter [Xylariaceae sp. FL0662B]|nr:major facilitator superfamily transporter [Xylariaceae sp. FL0662B]
MSATVSLSDSSNSVSKRETTDQQSDREVVDEAQQPPCEDWKPSNHEKAIIYTLAIISLLVALDASIIVTSLNAIITDLGGTAIQAFWIGTSYLLVNAVTMPIICAVSDVFGRPICLIFALVAFSVGTIWCCTAHEVTTMLVGRSIQGVGGAGIHALGLVIQTDIVPLRWRPKWYGVTLGAWAFGLSLGPIIGGAVVQHTTWRWIFYLMFPFCGFGLVAVPYLLTLKARTATVKEKLGRIDWLGSVMFTGSATSFLMAISWGGIQYPWNSYETIVPLVIGVFGLAVTVVYEMYFATQPFLRRSLFYSPMPIVTYILGCIQGLVMYGLLYYGPFYFLSVKAYNPLEAGVSMLAALLTVTIAGIISGRLVTRFNNYRWPMCIGWFIASIGAGLFLVWSTDDRTVIWLFTYLLSGLGQGTVLNAQNFASQAMCNPGDEASAAAMYAFVRQFGMALGVGVGGTAFQNVMALKLQWQGYPAEIAKQAEGYITILHGLPDGAYKAGIIDCYRFGFTGVYSVYLGLCVVALVLCAVFVRNLSLTRNLESEHQLDGGRLARHWGPKDTAELKTVAESGRTTGELKTSPIADGAGEQGV